MARIPLTFDGWEYDNETKRIVAAFVDAPDKDEKDPVNFISTFRLEVELLPRIVDEEAVSQPEQEQIDLLNVVVDQLVDDILMGGLL